MNFIIITVETLLSSIWLFLCNLFHTHRSANQQQSGELIEKIQRKLRPRLERLKNGSKQPYSVLTHSVDKLFEECTKIHREFVEVRLSTPSGIWLYLKQCCYYDDHKTEIKKLEDDIDDLLEKVHEEFIRTSTDFCDSRFTAPPVIKNPDGTIPNAVASLTVYWRNNKLILEIDDPLNEDEDLLCYQASLH